MTSSVLVAFLLLRKKYLIPATLRRKGFILAHSLKRFYSLVLCLQGMAKGQDRGDTAHNVGEKSREKHQERDPGHTRW